MMYILYILFTGLGLFLSYRIWSHIVYKKPYPRVEACKALFFLGSGGHTAEMLQLINSLELKKYSPRIYVCADSDALSENKVKEYENTKGSLEGVEYRVYKIPRARQVGQSLLSTPPSVLKALLFSVKFIFSERPELVVCNGPGSCVPICILALVLKVLGIQDTTIVYVESFARVKTLSLTGKLLYPLVDRFLVQWPELKEIYPGAEYLGILI
ncbi:UDP-N-acetylglucosamine transferase subunit [Basidiobolus ranarum]|uniref:UDP-N-acetylglucosamine transferase subunit ALG14 n=1 Tax=Basidiobolus ranarum TaxID=34480 RepID=A0ABR2WQL3_9FUNG